MQASDKQIDKLVDMALAEDAGRGDITSEILVPPDLQGRAYLLVKEMGVLAGIEVAQRVFLKATPSIQVDIAIRDGAKVQAGDVVANISGSLKGILKAERVALNFLQRLSGIASLTARYVVEVKGLAVIITDTRKTTPGLRVLEKYAVRMGGGKNHRLDLGDAVLIKDNHFEALRALGMSYEEIVTQAREKAPQGMKVEAEARTVQEALDAVAAGADTVMLDNMSLDDMRRAVKLVAGRATVEASGGVTLANVRAVAETGVDIISVGALTHSPRALDISLEVEPQTLKLL